MSKISLNESEFALEDGVISLENAGGSDNLIFTNVSVPSSAWASTTAYQYVKYAATVSLEGVTSNMNANVYFSPNDANSGNLSNSGVVNNGSITLLAFEQPTANITIPSIVCFPVS